MSIKKLIILLVMVISQAGISRDLPVYLSLQRRMAKPKFAQQMKELKMPNNVISVNGDYFHWSKRLGLEKSLAASRKSIKQEFKKFLIANKFPDNEKMIYLLDLERPSPPRFLWKLEPEVLEKVLQALKMRIEVAREVLKKSKIAIYGYVNPQPMGRYSKSFLKNLKASIYAGKIGVFDKVDYLTPVIYIVYGKKDRRNDKTWEAFTRQGLMAATLIKNSKGESIPLLPIASHWIHNGASRNHMELVPIKRKKDQLKVIAEYEQVKGLIYWIGWEGAPIKPGETSRVMTFKRFGTTKTLYKSDYDMVKYFKKIGSSPESVGKTL